MTFASTIHRARAALERPLEYQPAAGGAWVPVPGVLRLPTPDELVGGLDRESRLVSLRSNTFDALPGTPGQGDRIRDPETGRVYVTQSSWATHYAGRERVLVAVEVRG